MIPLQKLAALPRSQRFRKIVKDLTLMAEKIGRDAASDTEKGRFSRYFGDLAAFLATDEQFKSAESAAVAKIAAAAARDEGGASFFRNITMLRHILLGETGRSEADWDFAGSDGALDPSKRRVFPGMTVYLEDIRSPFNVGSMFRTAESFGVETIYLSPLCADPLHPRSLRSAMGCTALVRWERDAPDPALPLFALETGGTPLAAFKFPEKAVMIAGSEELGVSPEFLARADASLGRLSIPTYGAKGSLNVAAAFAIATQAWALQEARCLFHADGL
jgi:TrmH family RNA methyltransferase